MGNIEFSKVGQAILENKELADYISRRLANVTPEEVTAGSIVIELSDGRSLSFKFGPGRKAAVANSQLQPA